MKTKTLLLSSIFAIILSMEARSQKIFLKGGLTNSSAHVEYKSGADSLIKPDLSSKTGVHIGGVVDFPIHEMFALQTGMYYTQKGHKESVSETYIEYDPFTGESYTYRSSYDLTIKTNYLEIPLAFKSGLDWGDARLSLLAGGYLGIALKAKYSVKAEVSNPWYSETFSESEEIIIGENEGLHPYDFGLLFGADVEVGKFYAAATYSMGLQSAFPSAIESTYNNRSLMISIGMKIFEK